MSDAPAIAPTVLTLRETADLLRVSQRTVARMTARGLLRSLPLGGRIVRYAAADVRAIIEGAPAKAEHRSHLAAWHANREARER
jgi:excisionase family DNA binding protein